MIFYILCGLTALLAVGTPIYMFYPSRIHTGTGGTRLASLNERKEALYENLRDLNFEFKAGKLPEADYTSMKTNMEDEAAVLLAEIAELEDGK